MRALILIFTLFFCTKLYAQKTIDTGDVSVVVLNTVEGLYFCPQIQNYYPISDNLTFNPRVGVAFSVNGNQYWYIQSGILYRNGIFRAGFYPVWLRAYSKEIGYQTPTSLMFGYKSPLKLTTELWITYWYHEVIPSLGFTFKLSDVEHR